MTRQKHSNSEPPTSRYHDKFVMHELCSRVCDRAEDFFEELGIKLMRSGRRYVGRCPVHGGRSPYGLNFYPDGDTVKGYWICNSDHCDRHFVRSALGFVRGVLSHEEYGWENQGDKTVTHRQAVDFLLKFLNLDISEIKYDADRADRQAFASEVDYLTRRAATVRDGLCDRDTFRKYVEVPSHYYVDRGYSMSILDEYDVGLCTNPASEMNNRVVVPVYDPDHRMVIGCIGRSVNPQCDRCKLFHERRSPCPKDDLRKHVKWLCSNGFTDKHHLYNYWRAKGPILKSRCVVIVEGAGDVWRLEEAGIRNSVALFGSDVTDPQQFRFESCGATNFVVVTDRDSAGDKAAVQIERQCGGFAHVHRLELPSKDVGEMTVDAVRQHIRPFVESKMRRD